MTKLRKKKGDGGFGGFMITMIVIIVICGLSIGLLNMYDETMKYCKGHQIARNYMLKMESSGYLDGSNSQQLKQEFEKIGFKNINIDGSSIRKVNYGQDIQLIVSFEREHKELKLSNGWFSFEKRQIPTTITKISTAKN